MSGRAVVLGGGVAGLVTARVLADHFSEVTVVERGVWPAVAVPRPDVPQGHQAHVLLARGLLILQGLYPTLGAELDALGVPEVDFGQDLRQTLGDVPFAQSRAGVPMRCAPRPLLEGLLLRLTQASPQVRVRAACTATGLVFGPDRQVKGVTLAAPEGALLAADLVVDCRGRRSNLHRWLEPLGVPAPPTRTVDAGFGYASAVYRPARALQPGEPVAFFAGPRAPDYPLGCIAMHQPDGTLLVTLIGAPHHHPPTTAAEFTAAAAGVPLPDVGALLLGATLVSPPLAYKATENRLREVARVARWPGGYIALGDTVCALNPRFGQGMTVAALSAEILGRTLTRWGARRDTDPAGFARSFHRALASGLSTPWRIATADDATWAHTGPQTLAERLPGAFLQAVARLASTDPDTSVRFIRVAQMLDGPLALLHPRLLRKLLWAQLRPPAPALSLTAPAPHTP